MKLKKGVTLVGLKLPMRKVLKVADPLWDLLKQELVITAAVEDGHSPASFHPFGYAVDLRTRYFTREVKLEAFNSLKEQLPDAYDVVWHSSHIHVEYDPK